MDALAHSNDILLKPVTHLPGVGEKQTEKLQRLSIFLVADLLFHLPSKYQDRTKLHPIGSVYPGQEVLVEGNIIFSELVMRNRRMLLCHIDDGTGVLVLRFFHFSYQQQQSLQKGRQIRCFGEIRQVGAKTEMIHPEYRLHHSGSDLSLDDELTPVYPTTEGLQQRSLRRLVHLALEHIQQLPELLPVDLLDKYQLPTLKDSLHFLHTPTPDTRFDILAKGKHPAQQRLIFEELLAHQLGVQQARQWVKQVKAPAFAKENYFFEQLLKKLPFTPTQAQQRSIAEACRDMQKNTPMNRLIQGDVGSGKTLVAVAAALHAISNGYQVALMVPTELLAEQHYQNLCQWLEPLDLEVVFISGNQTAKQRRRKVENLLLGIGHIAVGTHALFQKTVEFLQLGLIIIDEQHRFGVHQRLELREKGKQGDYYPHQLVMTATPIPRTLAMSSYGDLDYSIIDELPPGRIPIKTVAISDEKRQQVIERIAVCCREGQQAYWVCTLIEESETLQCQAAEDTFNTLNEQLADINIGLIHGRLSSYEKEQIMTAFKRHETQLLIATTVIEVGVDVPNASLMVIENAERLGLSQLHQLRGRVGRGNTASSCVLLYQKPLGKIARKRLNALRMYTDGFEIANIDLEIRGAGEVLGTRQTGEAKLKIADLLRDQHLLSDVQSAAYKIVQEYPECIEHLNERWLKQADGNTANRLFQS